jgi:2,5-furandicarboxylate decarboxylase 1
LVRRIRNLSDLRDWIRAADKSGLLRRVKEETDLRRVSAILNEDRKRPMLFEKLVGYDCSLIGQVVSSMESVAFALGVEPKWETIREEYAKRMANPIEPVHVKSAPCQEICDIGSEVDLTKLPIPLQHSHDGGAYISAGVLVCKDPGTFAAAYPGEINLGFYRHMIYTKNQMGLDFVSPNRTSVFYKKCMEDGRPLQVATVIGLHPLAMMAAIEPRRDIEFMGALQGSPVELVRCKTIDLDVPANVEIVIEGEMPPTGWSVQEGPYGEFLGYQSERKGNPVFNIKAITCRRNPVFQTATIGTKDYLASDTANIYLAQGLHSKQVVIQEMRRRGFDVRDITESMGVTVVSMKKWFEGQARNLILSWGSQGFPQDHFPKYMIVVDEDIDVNDPDLVGWALSWRSRPDEDVVMVTGISAKPLDPSNPTHTYNATTSRMGIDATKPLPPHAQPHEWEMSTIPFESEIPIGRKTAREGETLQQLANDILSTIQAKPLWMYDILRKFEEYEYRSVLCAMCHLYSQDKIAQDNAGRWHRLHKTSEPLL